MKKKRLLYFVFPAITIILEILPYGAVCNFAYPKNDGSIEHHRQLFSYFDLTPFGYANFAPLLTSIVTCVAAVMLIFYCFTEIHSILKILKIFLSVGVVLSLCPLLLGITYFSVVGALITISLIAEVLFLHLVIKKLSK